MILLVPPNLVQNGDAWLIAEFFELASIFIPRYHGFLQSRLAARLSLGPPTRFLRLSASWFTMVPGLGRADFAQAPRP